MSPHEGRKADTKRAAADRRQLPHAEAFPAESKEPVDPAASVQQPPAGVQSVEPQNARLTGASGSLQRELLGLNVAPDDAKSEAQPAPDTPAGLHATGSKAELGKSNRGQKK